MEVGASGEASPAPADPGFVARGSSAEDSLLLRSQWALSLQRTLTGEAHTALTDRFWAFKLSFWSLTEEIYVQVNWFILFYFCFYFIFEKWPPIAPG